MEELAFVIVFYATGAFCMGAAIYASPNKPSLFNTIEGAVLWPIILLITIFYRLLYGY